MSVYAPSAWNFMASVDYDVFGLCKVGTVSSKPAPSSSRERYGVPSRCVSSLPYSPRVFFPHFTSSLLPFPSHHLQYSPHPIDRSICSEPRQSPFLLQSLRISTEPYISLPSVPLFISSDHTLVLIELVALHQGSTLCLLGPRGPNLRHVEFQRCSMAYESLDDRRAVGYIPISKQREVRHT